MRSILLIFSLLSLSAFAVTDMPVLPFNELTIKEDFTRILEQANLAGKISVEFQDSKTNEVQFSCKKEIKILVKAVGQEKTSTFYKGLRELGFYFPHPAKQISPSFEDVKKFCEKKWVWRPALKYRGFHLHTLHPSEWVKAFYQNDTQIADQTIRWMARNQQNIFDLSLLDVPIEEISKQMRPYFELAQKFQIYTGVSLGIALNQQNSYKLLSLWQSYFGWSADEKIEMGLKKLIETLPLSYVVLEAGTSEFTPTDFKKTLHWLNLSAKILRNYNLAHFTKVHVSSNQVSEKWGNFNFLPQYADSGVGILPHTVMFYGVVDKRAPMYGNKDFSGIREFMLKEKSKRPTWYYPETSYWVGMDVDVPLFLTDYLKTRTLDTKFLFDNGIEGQLNFTTGHAIGYWLFDWTMCLVNDLDYQFDHTIGLKLIGEDLTVWASLIAYQSYWYKEQGLISVLSSANLQDEISSTHRIHDRFTMKDLSSHPEALAKEIDLIKKAQAATHSYTGVKNEEIKTLLEINDLRLEHALSIRLALQNENNKAKHLAHAKEVRELAKTKIATLRSKDPYGATPIFDQWKNPTAYQFGYVYPASSLYFWEREERQIREDSYFPLWGNMYDFIDIVF